LKLTFYVKKEHSSVTEKPTYKDLEERIRLLEEESSKGRQAEDALRESEAKYRNVVENAQEAILIAQDVKLVFVNRAALHLTGYSEEQFLSGPFTDFIHPDDRNIVASHHLSRLMGEAVPPVYSFRVVRLDGAVRWVELNAAIISWEGNPATLNFLSDITERKRVADALRESEEKYRLLFENAGEGISIIRGEMIEFANPALAKILGQSIEIITIKSFTSFLHPDDRAMVLDHHIRRMRGEDVETGYDFRIITATGQVRWLHITSQIISWNGTPASLSFVMDITDRKVAEEALRESEYRFRELFDKMKSGVAVYEAINDGSDFIFRDFNRAAEIMEGVTKEMVIGKSVLEVFPGVKEFGLLDLFQSVWKSGIPRNLPISHYKDTRIDSWRENYVYKLPAGELVAIYDDVTEQKKMEEEIRMLSITDALTGLFNRRGFIALAEQQMKTANRIQKKLVLFYIDLDGMKSVNDRWGHEEGDQLLVSSAKILKQTFRESDIIARLGGDEFTVLAAEIAETTEIALTRLGERLKSYNALPNRRYAISLSIGIAVYDPSLPCSLDELMSRADNLMYEQKKEKAGLTMRTTATD
jgi:diguanylate cyclase (GGDEF)-like protein/PAS domain S-box-containing protein